MTLVLISQIESTAEATLLQHFFSLLLKSNIPICYLYARSPNSTRNSNVLAVHKYISANCAMQIQLYPTATLETRATCQRFNTQILDEIIRFSAPQKIFTPASCELFFIENSAISYESYNILSDGSGIRLPGKLTVLPAQEFCNTSSLEVGLQDSKIITPFNQEKDTPKPSTNPIEKTVQKSTYTPLNWKLEIPTAGVMHHDGLVRFKGWIQPGGRTVTKLLLFIAGKKVYLRTNTIRADIIEQLNDFSIIAFNQEVDVTQLPCRLECSIVMECKDGFQKTLKEFTVWKDKFKPEPQFSLTTVHVHHETEGLENHAEITLSAERSGKQIVEVWERGECLASGSIDDTKTYLFWTSKATDCLAHLWIREDDKNISLYCATLGTHTQNINLQSLALKGAGVFFNKTMKIEWPQDGSSPSVFFVNGKPVSALTVDDANMVEFSLKSNTLPAYLECLDHEGRILTKLLWSMLDRQYQLFELAILNNKYVDCVFTDGTETRVKPYRMVPDNGLWHFVFSPKGSDEVLHTPLAQISTMIPSREQFVPTGTEQREFVEYYRKNIRNVPDMFVNEQLSTDAVILPYVHVHKHITPKRIVLIRPAPAPTDELYIGCVLNELSEHFKLEYIIINTQTEAPGLQHIYSGDIIIVSRYINVDWLRELSDKRDSCIIYYIMDDDVMTAIDSRSIPHGYRRKIAEVTLSDFQAMLHLCDRFVVTAQSLERRYHSAKTLYLDPPCLRWPHSMAHHDDYSTVRIAYHGTDVHKDDISFLLNTIEFIGSKYNNIEFEYFAGSNALIEIRNKHYVRHNPPLSWKDYVKHAQDNPAHIVLAPMLDSPYNQGKSIIKFHDAASLGAVGIYSDIQPYDNFVTNGVNGFLVANDPAMWLQTIRYLLKNTDIIRKTAFNCQVTAKKKGDITHVENFWVKEIQQWM
ncbi:hypothetical protein [Maridesulfovibrio bastinii]|uniref:hypothetical protein n=1 Tax=Maridesulfovibrio bastinii TaxID=47157 RepID=UPI000427F148|nr:hypothetical protein [Maridesulfovibrio bastinii]